MYCATEEDSCVSFSKVCKLVATLSEGLLTLYVGTCHKYVGLTSSGDFTWRCQKSAGKWHKAKPEKEKGQKHDQMVKKE